MFLKSIAHSWATSKLQQEESHTRYLIRELDHSEKSAVARILARKKDYNSKIKTYQEGRNNELKAHIDFMNTQLNMTTNYLPELEQFQDLIFTCVESWMKADSHQQKIDIVKKKRDAIDATIRLLDAYISELNILSQRHGRKLWREFTGARDQTTQNDFVARTKVRIEKDLQAKEEKFDEETKRLKSHRKELNKEANRLRAERADLIEEKKAMNLEHKNNKAVLAERYRSCKESWREIRGRFETYYAIEESELPYVNEWIRELMNADPHRRIKSLLDLAHQSVQDAKDMARDLRGKQKHYKSRVQMAHNTEDYDTFDNDKEKRDRFMRKADAAWEDYQERIVARKEVFARRDELRGYYNRFARVHPDAAIDDLCEVLDSDLEFEPWHAIGINTKRQIEEYRKVKQENGEIATGN